MFDAQYDNAHPIKTFFLWLSFGYGTPSFAGGIKTNLIKTPRFTLFRQYAVSFNMKLLFLSGYAPGLF
jgi:hypothetical protein